MIKSSTLQKRKSLSKEVDQRAHDINVFAGKLVEVSAKADMLQKELNTIKSHWLYRFIKWFK